LKRWPSARDFL